MKVLTIGTDRKLFEDGSAVFTRQLEYSEKIDELHIIVFSLQKHGLKEIHKGNLHIYPTNSRSRLQYIFDGARIGKKIILENKFTKKDSVISTQDPFETGLVGYFLKRKHGLPLQFQVHTDFLSPYFKNSLLNRVRVVLAKWILPNTTSIRVVSSVISDSIKDAFPKLKARIDVLPIFVDVQRIESIMAPKEQVSPSPFKFEKNMLMFSRLTKEKRFDIALQTMSKVVKAIPDIGLVIFGSGPERHNIENLIQKLGLTGKVSLEGWVSNDEVLRLFSSKTSGIFLLTSEFEGYGMTLIEAGAAGCPIVTTAVGVAKTNLFKSGENSFVCPVGDVDCLSKSILKLLLDASKRQLFKERMQDSIRKTAMTKEEYADTYIGLLGNLI